MFLLCQAWLLLGYCFARRIVCVRAIILITVQTLFSSADHIPWYILSLKKLGYSSLYCIYDWLLTREERFDRRCLIEWFMWRNKQPDIYFFNLDSCSIVLRQILVTWRYWSNTAQTNKRYDTQTPLMEKNYSSSYCYVSWITKQ